MKRTIGYLIIGLVLSGILFTGYRIAAYSETGHEDFKKIIFVGEDRKLLRNYREATISQCYKHIPRNFFGWRTYYFNLEEEALYEGATVFSRGNRSSQPVGFEYVLKETEVTKKSVSVKGSVSAKITGTMKKINMTFGGAAETVQGWEDSYTSDSKTSLNFTISPNTKLSLIVTGRCYVTTAVSRYRFFGISFRKGAWENIDTETIVYELREEKL